MSTYVVRVTSDSACSLLFVQVHNKDLSRVFIMYSNVMLGVDKIIILGITEQYNLAHVPPSLMNILLKFLVSFLSIHIDVQCVVYVHVHVD